MTKFITITESTAVYEYNLETLHINILPCNNKHLKQDMYTILINNPVIYKYTAYDIQ